MANLSRAIERLRGTAWRVAAGSGVALSIAVQAVGVFGDDRGAWFARHGEGEVFSLRDTQIEAYARHLLGLDAAAE